MLTLQSLNLSGNATFIEMNALTKTCLQLFLDYDRMNFYQHFVLESEQGQTQC